MHAYDVNADWEDPCEPVEDRRGAVRFAAHRMLDIAVRSKKADGHMIGPGKLKDLSMSGAGLVTKHRLRENDRVQLRINTEDCPRELALPRNFVGSARVVHVRKKGGRSRHVALQFNESLTDSMEFAVFINHLHQQSHGRPALSN